MDTHDVVALEFPQSLSLFFKLLALALIGDTVVWNTDSDSIIFCTKVNTLHEEFLHHHLCIQSEVTHHICIAEATGTY